jgi:hypothetical protein
MEIILLGLVGILCIYILYCIFTTTTKEPFTDISDEGRLGALATTITAPTNTDKVGNNPTGLLATVSRLLDGTAIKNTYHSALGRSNTGPRIDDTNSLLSMIDFCFETGKTANPFGNTTFAANCGMCMTTGTTLHGTNFTGSNGSGVVVYQADKEYSILHGVDAVPSAHSATCAPIIRTWKADSNVTSLAINSAQYTKTLEYMKSYNYTIHSGTGPGQHTVMCSDSDIIKGGFYRDGAWDTHIGSQVDYSRKNLLTTIPLDHSCIDKESCTINTSSLQWEVSTLCGRPVPGIVTGLRVVEESITPSGMTFVWDANSAKNATMFDYTLVRADGSGVTDGIGQLQNGNSVVYTGLSAGTIYTFNLTVKNAAGAAPTVVAGGMTKDDRKGIYGIGFARVFQTEMTAIWSGGDNAKTVTLRLTDGTSTSTFTGDPTIKMFRFTDLSPGTSYTLTITSTYETPGTLSVSATQSTPDTPAQGNQLNRVRNIQARWVNGSVATGGTVEISWEPSLRQDEYARVGNYHVMVGTGTKVDDATGNVPPAAIRTGDPFYITQRRIPAGSSHISVWPMTWVGYATAPLVRIAT